MLATITKREDDVQRRSKEEEGEEEEEATGEALVATVEASIWLIIKIKERKNRKLICLLTTRVVFYLYNVEIIFIVYLEAC